MFWGSVVAPTTLQSLASLPNNVPHHKQDGDMQLNEQRRHSEVLVVSSSTHTHTHTQTHTHRRSKTVTTEKSRDSFKNKGWALF